MTRSQELPETHPRVDDEVAEALLVYLAEHPKAMDTLEGIAEWWLLRQHVRVVVQRVAGGLRRLCDEGVLEVVGYGAERRYRLRTVTHSDPATAIGPRCL